MAHYQPDQDEPSIFGGVNDNPNTDWMAWHRFKFKSEPAEILKIGKQVLKQLLEEDPRNYPLPLLKSLLDYKGSLAPLANVIEFKYRNLVTWEQANTILLQRAGSDAHYARAYHQNRRLTRRMHELAVSKGYDHMALAIAAAPPYSDDQHVSEDIAATINAHRREHLDNCVYLRQGEYKLFAGQDDDEVRKVVVSVTGSYIYNGASEQLANIN